MTVPDKLSRFARKSPADQWLAIAETGKTTVRNFNRQITGTPRLIWAALNERYRRKHVFREIYKKNIWGSDGASQYFSGAGSRGEHAETYVRTIAELLEVHAAELRRSLTVVDLGCGDFEVGRALVTRVPDMIYIGCDIVPELIAYNTKTYATERISFLQLDIVTDPLPHGDVCLVRQVLQHLSNSEIIRFLQRVDYEYLYVTEGQPTAQEGPVNPDKAIGHQVRFDLRSGRGRGVELDKPPYCLSTEEVFRVQAFPTEIIVTQRVFRQPG